jgi:hypothetical protein
LIVEGVTSVIAGNGGLVNTWGGSVAATILLGIALTACQGNDGTKANSVLPENVLISSFLDPCPQDRSARHGTVAVMGTDFQPRTTVTLNWSVARRDLQGSWDSVVSSKKGDFTAKLDLPAEDLKPGDLVVVWAQGSGKDGIMALSTKVPIGSC